MKMIPTIVHGAADYLAGILLLAAPNIFGFADAGGPAVIIPRIIGVIVLLQSVCTNYELGLVKVLPMKVHLMNDYIAGAFLAASPWLFGFHKDPTNHWMPHVFAGLGVLVLTALTEAGPRRSTINA